MAPCGDVCVPAAAIDVVANIGSCCNIAAAVTDFVFVDVLVIGNAGNEAVVVYYSCGCFRNNVVAAVIAYCMCWC